MFYKYVPNLKEKPKYWNPFLILVLGASIAFGTFVTTTFVAQTVNIGEGYTIKQKKSIKDEISKLMMTKTNGYISSEYTRKRTSKEKLWNVINFLRARIEKSLIIPERDLINTS